MAQTITNALAQATRKLDDVSSAAATLEAKVLLSFALGKPQSYLYAWPERQLDQSIEMRFNQLVNRRLNGEPLAYVTGRREFWSLDLEVSPDTLIPRQETELLVELALDLAPKKRRMHIADLGTGSGAIALAIAKERPQCQITATDISPEALAIANNNLIRLGLANVQTFVGSWFEPFKATTRFDVIVSNPPYIPPDDPHLGGHDLAWEPATALVSKHNGLHDIRSIANTARSYLAPSGWLLLEHGYDQDASVRAILTEAGFLDIRTHTDLYGKFRVTKGQNVGEFPYINTDGIDR